MRFFNIIILLAFIILLQIFLSTRKSKWCRLILPIISFLFALVIVPLNMMAPPTGIDFSYIVKMIVTFLVFNIPTIFSISFIECVVRIKKNRFLGV